MLSTQFCPTCGAANEAAQTQCFACGHTLSTDPDTSTAALDGPHLHERYQLGTILGSGGYSTVYRAHDVQTGREVAIKQISLQGLSAEEAIEATDTFNREATVLSSLRHPQIPQFYDQFNDQDHWYLVLQFLEGPTLETYLETRTTQGKPLQFDEVLSMALQLGEVLNYLHTRQPPIIFRDLKPGNIMRTPPKGTLCLVDFGIARRFRAGQKHDTQALGSPGYAAPEQYGRAQTTPRSDIYSLGALLHFLLSGDDPAEEASPGLKPLHLHAEKGAKAISELVQRMLSPDPELRPATMSEVITALEAVQRQRTTQPAAHVWQPPVPQDLPTSPDGWRQIQAQVSAPPSAAQTPAAKRHGPSRRKVLIGLGGALVAVGIGGWGLPRLIHRLDFPPGRTIYTYLGHTASVTSISWSPNGKYIASASKDTTVQVWDATTGKTLLTYRGHKDAVTYVAWSPNGKYIASASEDTTVQVWDATTGETTLTYQGHKDSVNAVAWSPDSKRIASGSDDQTAQVWDATTGKAILTHQETKSFSFSNDQLNSVNAVAWSPDSQYIASGSSRDSVIQIWNATTGETLPNLDTIVTVTSLAWSPDSKLIASGYSGNTADIWNITTDTDVASHDLGFATNETIGELDQEFVTAVTWSPDGQHVATSSTDQTVQVWDATSNSNYPTLTYQGHKDSVNAVIWSPDGQYIASGSDDNTVQVWIAP